MARKSTQSSLEPNPNNSPTNQKNQLCKLTSECLPLYVTCNALANKNNFVSTNSSDPDSPSYRKKQLNASEDRISLLVQECAGIPIRMDSYGYNASNSRKHDTVGDLILLSTCCKEEQVALASNTISNINTELEQIKVVLYRTTVELEKYKCYLPVKKVGDHVAGTGVVIKIL
ncbi:MAG: hypothetical protein LBP41_04200 [Holosporaceae bacterium]|jgi:hypothetical protein|nr:hypothetical protein [Holosporaceae bacterium]